MNDEFYQSPLPKLAQGDIFLDIPSVFLSEQDVTFIRRRVTPRGPTGDLYTVGDASRAPKAKAFDPNDDEAVSRLQLANAMLLTPGCELDNSPRSCVSMVLIRPLRTAPPEAHEGIRSARNLRVLLLPSNDAPALEESYIDFSRITSIRLDALPIDRRLLSASGKLLTAVYFGLTRYITRFEPPQAALEPLVEKAIREANES